MGDRKVKARGFVLIAAGVGIAAVVAVLGWIDKHSVAPRYSMALLAVMTLSAVVLVASGVGSLTTARRVAAGLVPDHPVSYRHTYRLFGVIAAALLFALLARSWAVPATFGQYGYYRGDAPSDAREARVPRFQGKQACAECHEFQFNNHEKDVHRTVQCEDCHGPADVHVKADEKTGNINIPKTKDWCLVCHRQLPARPGPFPQVSWRDHFRFVGVKESKFDEVQCIDCHDPHEPLFLTKPVVEARLHPLIHRCRDCHVGRTDETAKRPENHPAIFECGYCHEAIVKDADSRTHYQVKCTTCHLFLRDSDFAGRIVRNANPRFCLLCHGKTDLHDHTDFRSADAPPGRDKAAPIIEWPKHLTEHDEKNKDDTTPCVGCHSSNIHGDELVKHAAKEPVK